VRPPLPVLSVDWWQGFLHGNADALLGGKDALRAFDLIADKLGKDAGQLDINGSIRSCELRKRIYAEFGASPSLRSREWYPPEPAIAGAASTRR